MKRPLAAVLLASLALVTSCSAAAQQDTSAKAILDRDNNIIIKPIAE